MSRGPFEYQAPTEAHVDAIQRVRAALNGAYLEISAVVPACAEKTLAVRKLEEASMWANTAIVFDGERYLP